MLKAVLFDMDGVIVDTEPLSLKTHKIMLGDYGKEYTEEFHKSVMGNSINEVAKKIIEGYDIKIDEESFIAKRTSTFEKLLEEELVAIDGLVPLLKKIKENGLRCAVATGSCKSTTDKIMKKLNILQYFDLIICNEEIIYSKPDPWVYKVLMEKLSVKPEECVILEDSKNGIIAAMSAGCKVIAVNSIWEYNGEEQVISMQKDLTGVYKVILELMK